MKITVEDNSLQVAKNFEKQVREQPQIVKTALGRTAEFLMFLIKQRTSRGISADNNAFPKYTAEYAFTRQKAGRQTSIPDLNFKGQMLSNITQKSNPNYAIIYFANKFQNVKALGNQTKRKFFAISSREVEPVMNVFMKEYNKLSKI
jgi:phage gpG-like protein